MKIVGNIVLLSMCLCGYALAYDENVYNLSPVRPYHMMGWLGKNNSKMLETFIKKMQPRCVVELGSWLGKSAIFMGHLLSKKAKLYCVDHWKGSVEHHSEKYGKILPTLYEQFLSNIIHEKLTHVIVPVRMATLQAAEELQINPELVYVDAAHDEESVFNDICAWWPKLTAKGVMCGDDFSFVGVRAAVSRAAEFLRMTYHVIGGRFWWFDPK